MSEQIILQRAKLYKFPAISLRLFNVYGLRSRTVDAYSAVINLFLKKKLNNKPLTVAGDGLQSRSFVYVSDVVNAIIKSAKSKISNEIFNVGSQKSVQISKIAQLLNGKKIYIPNRLGDPRHSSANIRKIKRQLDWIPKISIEEGIKLILNNTNS